MKEFKINIVHLYPDLLNLYGDKGNIECLKKRLLWRNIDVEVKEFNGDAADIDFDNTDIVFLGGGSDREQEIVCSRLMQVKDKLKVFSDNGGTIIALCGGFELLGKAYGFPDDMTEALGLFDFKTVYPKDNTRLIGNVVIKCNDIESYVVGFENHAGRIDIGDKSPLGTVVKGFGNDGKGNVEGFVCKNVFASYLHGPLFPKNPKLCDLILSKTLKHKYADFDVLPTLDDEIEDKANDFMLKVLL